MSLQRFSVKFPITILMLFSGIILLGIISLNRLNINLFPDISTPKIKIELTSNDKSPEEIEKKYTEKIERQVSTINGLKNVYSISTIGKSVVDLEFYWDTDMDFTLLEVQKKVASISSETDVKNLIVTKEDFQSLPIMTIAYFSEENTDIDRLRKEAEEAIIKRLETLEGVAKGELFGEIRKEILIRLDKYKLQAYDLTESQIISKIENTNIDASGGRIEDNEIVYIVKGVGKFRNLNELKNLIIDYKTKQTLEGITERIPVYLKDVASIRYQNVPVRSYSKYNKRNCIGISIYKEADANTINVSDRIKEELIKIKEDLPGSEIEIVNEQSEFINLSIKNLQNSLLIGILLAVLIIFLFLRNIWTTFIISLAIPISIIATFNLMYYFNLSINLMTLGGLALGAGMLVDNAVVVIENIFRHREKGEELIKSVDSGTSEVGAAISASTLTTIIVFFPIVYVKGIGAEFFKDQGFTVVFSLLSSLLIAFTLIPMLASKFFKEVQIKTKKIRWKEKYANYLAGVLVKRKTVLIITGTLILACVYLLPKLQTKLIPESDVYEFDIQIELPEGKKIEYTKNVVERIEDIIYEIYPGGIEKVFTRIGETPKTTVLEGEVNKGYVYVQIKKAKDVENAYKPREFFGRLKSALALVGTAQIDLKYHLTSIDKALGQEKRGITIEISGRDLNMLDDISTKFITELSKIEGLYNVNRDLNMNRKEVIVELDRVIASSFGLNITSVSNQLNSFLEGKNAGEMFFDGDDRSIRISYPDVYLADLYNFEVKTPSNNYIKLKNISNIRLKESPVYIYRKGQKPTVSIFAIPERGYNYNKIVGKVKTLLNEQTMPKNYSISIAGEEKEREESFQNLQFALILAIILVYMVMAALFESLILPFTIMFTLPLAGIGPIILFFIISEPISLMAIIGIIMLAGIAVNNSIVLVDCINRYQRQNMDLIESIITAGKDRIRPILITTLTTILALLPLAIGVGEGSELRSPLSLAVISGLVTSTFLTLFVIPVVYLYFSKFASFFKK